MDFIVARQADSHPGRLIEIVRAAPASGVMNLSRAPDAAFNLAVAMAIQERFGVLVVETRIPLPFLRHPRDALSDFRRRFIAVGGSEPKCFFFVAYV